MKKQILIALALCLTVVSLSYSLEIGQGTMSLFTTLAGEDTVNDILVTEERYSFDGNITADKSVKAGPGFVHSMVCIGTDAAATAGTIILYDNTAESGTIVFSWAVQAVAYTQPVVIPLNVITSVGLYLGFTTTADVTCTVSYR